MRPERVQLSRTRGWRMPPDTVKVDRTTSWGNPFRVGAAADAVVARRWGWTLTPLEAAPCQDVGETLKRLRARLANDPAARANIIFNLSGKHLACWCKPDASCHADLLLSIANGDPM